MTIWLIILIVVCGLIYWFAISVEYSDYKRAEERKFHVFFLKNTMMISKNMEVIETIKNGRQRKK